MQANPFPHGKNSVDAYRRARDAQGRHDLFAANGDATFWQVNAFDHAGELWRVGDELPAIAGTGISRHGLSRLAAFQDVGVELPPDYQLSVCQTDPRIRECGKLATVRDGRLAEIDVPRDPTLPWLYYHGRLGQTGGRTDLEGRVRDQTRRLDEAGAAYQGGLTGTVDRFYPEEPVDPDDWFAAHFAKQPVDWPHEFTDNIHFADYFYVELTSAQQARIVEKYLAASAVDETVFSGKTRGQIHQLLLRANDDFCNCDGQLDWDEPWPARQ
jgi:hypothetical protein